VSIEDPAHAQAIGNVFVQQGMATGTDTEAGQMAAALALAALMDSLEHRLRVLGDTTALTRLRSAQSALTTCFNLNQEAGVGQHG
jgi:hypothetical protein